MTAKEFKPVWERFCKFYNAQANEIQAQIFFSEYEYLPIAAVKHLFENVMRAERGFGGLPTIQQIEPHKNAVAEKRNKMKVKQFNNEPDLPDLVRLSNVTFMKLLIETHTAKSLRSLQYVIDVHAQYWAKWWKSRKRIEFETNCDPYWQTREKSFEATARGIDTAFLEKVYEILAGSKETEIAETEYLRDSVPF